MSKNIVMADEVLQWPEFQNLADRLGIDLSKETDRLAIDLCKGEAVRIDHEYFGSDISRY